MRRPLAAPPIMPTIEDVAGWLEDLAAASGDRSYSRAAEALTRPAPGQRTLATRTAMAQRDEELRSMGCYFAGSTRQRAADMSRTLDRYRAGAWRLNDSRLTSAPERYNGTPFEHAFAILRLGLPIPGERRIRALISPHSGP